MAVTFSTTTPKELLDAFNARIEQSEAKGKITTWARSDDKKYYTHKAEDWARKAWFKPVVSTGTLTFNIIKSQGSSVSTVVYAYYHGHLIETFLNHFDKIFSSSTATALPTTGDSVS